MPAAGAGAALACVVALVFPAGVRAQAQSQDSSASPRPATHVIATITTAADTARSIVAPVPGTAVAAGATPTAPVASGPAVATSTAPQPEGGGGTGEAGGGGNRAGAAPLTSNILPAVQPTTVGSTFETIPLERVVAVVGDEPILWSNILERINVERAQGLQIPPDSVGQMGLARTVANELVDEQLLVAKARDLKLEVTDEEVAPGVDAQIKRVRGQFPSDAVYRAELRRAGFGTPEDYRRMQMDQARRAELQRKVIDELKKDGKLTPVGVSDKDVSDAFEHTRGTLPQRPATVTFRQIIVAPKPSPAAKAAARAKADSILAQLKRDGADANEDRFAEAAKRESMDPGTREVGGDLGWNRRGVMVPEFDMWMFGLRPGTLSPVIETAFGFHIIRVDRVKPGEVKASHILIRWRIDSTQVAAAGLEADSVLAAWKAGANVDSLTIKHHDPREEKGALQPFPRDSLPPSYSAAFAGRSANDFVGPFPIDDKSNGTSKFVVAKLLSAEAGGAYTLADFRSIIRSQLAEERSIRRLLDSLREETYVSVRL
jgi:peptidyl-prolyl cis-trans isomerase SurA